MTHRILAAGFLLLSVWTSSAWGQALELPWTNCGVPGSPNYNATDRIHIENVYGQLVTHTPYTDGYYLNFTILGYTDVPIEGRSQVTQKLATMFTNTSVLSFDVWDNATWFCSSVRPESPLPYPLLENGTSQFDSNATYCPLTPGPLAFAASVPLPHAYTLTTLNTQIRVVDSSSPPIELACLDIATSPMPKHAPGKQPFGILQVICWFSVGLTILYWAVVGMARISAAWRRAGRGPSRIAWSDVRWAGTVLASAISGERLAASPALLRIATPSARDIIFHTQWSFSLGLIAVQWPQFAYPYFANVAWASLIYNITLTQGPGGWPDKHWDPLTSPPLNLSANFSDQIQDPTSPIYLDLDAPNYLLAFPPDTAAGIPSVAATIGVRPQDMFGVCVALFLIILGGVVIISAFLWTLSWLASLASGRKRMSSFFPGTKSPTFTGPLDIPKEFSELDGVRSADDLPSNGHSNHGHSNLGHSNLGHYRTPGRKGWWTYRLGQGSFHGSVLHGNLIRLLMLFHLPITIFSVYQFTLNTSTLSVALAALVFAIISVIIPALLLIRIATIPTSKLYDATRTLLAFGPLYNVYIQKSQMFAVIPFISSLLTGITIGAAQKSGIAQAVIILVIEVSTALATSIWLPWGKGAQMGIISFLFVVGRISTAVLLVILSPTVSVGASAGGWITIAVLIIQGLIYLIFFFMLICKILEGIIRLITGVSFDKSAHSYDSGLIGAIRLGCFPNHRRKSRRGQRNSEPALSGTSSSGTQMLTGSPSVSPAYAPVPNTLPSAPLSFLSPEHASRPYQETDDDPNYSIMRAWQPFPQPAGYGTVNTSPRPSNTSHERVDMQQTPMMMPRQTPPQTPMVMQRQTPPQTPIPAAPQTGFTRIRGGRANADSPYMIAPGQAPTTGRTAAAPRPPSPASQKSALAAARAAQIPRTPPAAPPSAWPGSQTVLDDVPVAPRLHVRTKSQTAIIEDASLPPGARAQTPPMGGSAMAGPSRPQVSPSPSRLLVPTTTSTTAPAVSGRDAESQESRRKRGWFNKSSQLDGASDEELETVPATSLADPPDKPHRWFRRNRRRSEGDVLAPHHDIGPQDNNKSSFVVMRPMRPSPGSSTGGAGGSTTGNRPIEFVIPPRPSLGTPRPSTSSSMNTLPPSLPRKSSKRRPSSSGT